MFRYRSVFKAGMFFMVLLVIAGAVAYWMVRDDIPSLSPERVELQDWSRGEILGAFGEPVRREDGCWVYSEGKICFQN